MEPDYHLPNPSGGPPIPGYIHKGGFGQALMEAIQAIVMQGAPRSITQRSPVLNQAVDAESAGNQAPQTLGNQF